MVERLTSKEHVSEALQPRTRKNVITYQQLDKHGNFKCPRCDGIISPDDFSNATYKIVALISDVRGHVYGIVIQCSCNNFIEVDFGATIYKIKSTRVDV